MPYLLFLKKAAKIENYCLLQIIGGALWVKIPLEATNYQSRMWKIVDHNQLASLHCFLSIIFNRAQHVKG